MDIALQGRRREDLALAEATAGGTPPSPVTGPKGPVPHHPFVPANLTTDGTGRSMKQTGNLAETRLCFDLSADHFPLGVAQTTVTRLVHNAPSYDGALNPGIHPV
jgi:hypothetical protein